MSLRRQLGVSFALQGAGSASVLLATLWLGASLGPEVQGGFSHTKAEIEFIAAVAMFGLPQSLFFHVKSGALAGRVAQRWALASAVLALPIGAAYGLAQHAQAPSGVLALFGLAVAAYVAHGQLRVLLLARLRTEWFNVLTALPQVLVLAGVGIVIGWGVAVAAAQGTPVWLGVFALAYAASAFVAWRLLGAAPDAPATVLAPAPGAVQEPAQAGWRVLGRYGLATWLAAVLATAAALAVQRWVEGSAGLAALGQFTLAMTLVQVPLTPVTYAAPLLFRRWMEQSGARVSQRLAAVLFLGLLAVAAAVGLAAPVWPDLALGPAYGGATAALALLLAGGAAEAASRVLTVQASASGLPWVGVRAEVARWAVLGAGWLLLPAPQGLLALCAVWAAAAWAAALVVALQARAAAATAAAAATGAAR